MVENREDVDSLQRKKAKPFGNVVYLERDARIEAIRICCHAVGDVVADATTAVGAIS